MSTTKQGKQEKIKTKRETWIWVILQLHWCRICFSSPLPVNAVKPHLLCYFCFLYSWLKWLTAKMTNRLYLKLLPSLVLMCLRGLKWFVSLHSWKPRRFQVRPGMCCVIKLMRRLTTCWSHADHLGARKVEKPWTEHSRNLTSSCLWLLVWWMTTRGSDVTSDCHLSASPPFCVQPEHTFRLLTHKSFKLSFSKADWWRFSPPLGTCWSEVNLSLCTCHVSLCCPSCITVTFLRLSLF